ncbi:Rieske 2Fe-2S domain-containing protein [Nocardia macrotermitis]|uniref:Rieske-type oxygenase n=1 Tax=Nocardia macrotermitis TaxID=2585198 RepID=A0A7K0DFL8_9NOCA|nr:Rieske 2Fe-2S domain-containing protein [Nocardia macrotermitis]MQY24331.1 3-ketosteroid-9-alpha-monooxygenase, oxygenase component [Nocardia macrotermitis]
MATSAEYKLGEYRFPRGWFAVADGAEITTTPTNTRYFGEDVVIYRGETGAPVMLGAYCPHMGTHLGRNTASYTVTSGRQIEGDSIRCPFHGWRYGPDGICNDIPYSRAAIGPLARVRSWITQERYGIVFCWNDPEGQPPDFDLPDFPEWDDPDWLRWSGLQHLADLPCHPIEVFDNNSDIAHLQYLHGGAVQRYENVVEGHIYRQRQSLLGQSKTGAGHELVEVAGNTITTVNSYIGPGLNAARFEGMDAAQIIATTPIDDGCARLWQCAMVKRPAGLSDEQAQQMLATINNSFAHGLGTEDGEIWANKKPATRILQMAEDGPFKVGRTWYRQFFNPRERAADILTPVSGLHTVDGVPGFTLTSA